MRILMVVPGDHTWFTRRAFGAGYLAKLPVAKPLDEVYGTHKVNGMAQFWNVLGCIVTLGGFYFAKVPAKRALEQQTEAQAVPGNKCLQLLRTMISEA